MERLEDMQKAWQEQRTPALGSGSELLRALRSHSRRMVTVYTIKSVLVILFASVIIWAVRHSPIALTGAALVIGGAAVSLAIEWTRNLAFTRLEFSSATTAFLRDAIGNLRRLERPIPAQYASLFLGPLLGLNVMEFVLLRPAPPVWRIAGHAGLSLLAISAVWAGLWVRRRRYRRETAPVLRRLEALAVDMRGPDDKHS